MLYNIMALIRLSNLFNLGFFNAKLFLNILYLEVLVNKYIQNSLILKISMKFLFFVLLFSIFYL